MRTTVTKRVQTVVPAALRELYESRLEISWSGSMMAKSLVYDRIIADWFTQAQAAGGAQVVIRPLLNPQG